jgi:hypothetical protein
MKKVNLFDLYRFGKTMEFFDKLTPATSVGDIAGSCSLASSWFDWLLASDRIPIADCRADIDILKKFCRKVSESKKTNEPIGDALYSIVNYQFSHFESVLSAELARLDIYFVTPVGGYNTDKLLSDGTACLPQSTLGWMSEIAIRGFNEGARCLALKLPTAAAFHFLRSVEAIMRQYFDALSGGVPRPKRENMGEYIGALEKIDAVDDRMLEVLKSVKNLRRNPLMHPQDFLEPDDALITFDVAKSAISTMAQLAREYGGSAASKGGVLPACSRVARAPT